MPVSKQPPNYLSFDCLPPSRWAIRPPLLWSSGSRPEIAALWFHQSAGSPTGRKCEFYEQNLFCSSSSSSCNTVSYSGLRLYQIRGYFFSFQRNFITFLSNLGPCFLYFFPCTFFFFLFQGASSLLDMILYYESTTHLDISDNSRIGTSGWRALAHLIKQVGWRSGIAIFSCRLSPRDNVHPAKWVCGTLWGTEDAGQSKQGEKFSCCKHEHEHIRTCRHWIIAASQIALAGRLWGEERAMCGYGLSDFQVGIIIREGEHERENVKTLTLNSAYFTRIQITAAL